MFDVKRSCKKKGSILFLYKNCRYSVTHPFRGSESICPLRS